MNLLFRDTYSKSKYSLITKLGIYIANLLLPMNLAMSKY